MRYKLYTYDLWADGEGCMQVNDIYPQGTIQVKAKLLTFNLGEDSEFCLWDITDRQLNRAIGARGLKWEGDLQGILYATDRKGNPACELHFIPSI